MKLSHPCILWLFLLCPVSCSICYGINAWSWVDKCLVPWRTHVESWNSGLSAKPNDGIHLLFYGHSWSSVAPIWPKAHILSLLFHLFLPHSFHCPSWFFVFFFALPYFTFFISNCSATFSQCLPFSIFILYSLSFWSFVAHCPDVLFMVYSHKLLIWGGLAACASRGDKWMKGWRPTRCPYSQTSEQYVTQLPDDLDHSTLQGSYCASSSWG